MTASVFSAGEAIPRARAALAVLAALLVAPGPISPLRAADPAAADRVAAERIVADRIEKADEPSEEAAVAAIEKLGGKVRRVRKGAGREVAFHLRGRKLTDAGLAHVAALKDVVSLNLRDTSITGAGLSHLGGLTGLRWLHLERTGIGDEGTEHLARLVNLEYLNLYGTKITDRALAHLEGLKKLKRLYVWKTGVTDAGVARLEKALPRLKIVRGVDLATLPDYVPPELDIPVPKEDLKWLPVADAREVPKSQTGLNTLVIFQNKSSRLVKVVWISYGGEPKLYGLLEPGATREQNTYSRNAWLITDNNDRALGYFIVGTEVARAVIPPQPEPENE